MLFGSAQEGSLMARLDAIEAGRPACPPPQHQPTQQAQHQPQLARDERREGGGGQVEGGRVGGAG
eukprot:2706013-Rhodomonas_salina.1